MTTTITQAEATRDELIAEWMAREAISTVHNRMGTLLQGEDEDIVAKMAPIIDDERSGGDALVRDQRREELFEELWPESTEGTPEFLRANAETCYIAARIMRSIVYHADHLRGEAQLLFKLADEMKREAETPEAVR